MSAGKDAGSGTFDWYVEADRAAADSGRHVHLRSRRDEDRAHSLGLIVTTTLLFVLFAAAIMFGGHAAIAPLLNRASAARDANGKGDIVYTMPDGVFCRHLSFDNVTGEVTEGAIEPCQDSMDAAAGGSSSKFKWGAH